LKRKNIKKNKKEVKTKMEETKIDEIEKTKPREIIKIEGELDFEPAQVVATDDVGEALTQNWLECLPRVREFSKIRIIGNSIVITPVDIIEVS
jgi:hypothetical protein